MLEKKIFVCFVCTFVCPCIYGEEVESLLRSVDINKLKKFSHFGLLTEPRREREWVDGV